MYPYAKELRIALARIRELKELWGNAVTARDELYTRNVELEAAETALKGVVEARDTEIAKLEVVLERRGAEIIRLNELRGNETYELEAEALALREALGAADKVFAQMIKNGDAARLPRILRIGFDKARAKIQALKGV